VGSSFKNLSPLKSKTPARVKQPAVTVKAKPAKAVIKKPVTPKELELAQQEAIVFLFIMTRLDAKFQNSDSAQYIATAVMGGQGKNKDRMIIQRTIDRLVAKGCLRIIEKGGRDSKGRLLQSVHGLGNPKAIWGNKGSMHKSEILCKAQEWSFVQGQKGIQVPEEPTTSPLAESAICARAETVNTVHKSSSLNSTVCNSDSLDHKTVDSGSVGACARQNLKNKLQEMRDELAHHERTKNSKRMKACRTRIAELEAELEGTR
jgi:hypothetical protein